MNERDILRAAERAADAAGGRDPFKAAQALGVSVIFEDYGRLLGMYAVVRRCRFIFLNRNLEPALLRIVCAHELGHDALHRGLAGSAGMREYALRSMNDRPEYEANLFAACFLLPGEETAELARSGLDAAQIAAATGTSADLAAMRLSLLSPERLPEFRRNFLRG